MSQNYFGNYIYKYDNIRQNNSGEIIYDFLKDPNNSDIYFDMLVPNGNNRSFSKRFGHQIISYANKLFLIGGTEIKRQNTGATLFNILNDIWYTTNCLNWKKIDVDSNWTIENYYGENSKIEINALDFQFPKITDFQLVSTINGIYIIGGIVKNTFDLSYYRKNKYIFDIDSPIYKDQVIKNNINKIIIKLELNNDILKPYIIITDFTGISNLTHHRCIRSKGIVYLFDYNSVWYSTNFSKWYNLIPSRKNSAYNQFTYRRDYGVAYLNNYFYAIGGNNDNGIVLNDVWRSKDCISWEQILQEADWEPRYSFGCSNFKVGISKKNTENEYILIVGGKNYQSNDNSLIPMSYGDMWYSQDGINWNQVSINLQQRSNIAMCMYGTRSIIIGGCYDTMLEYCSQTWAVDSYNDIYAYGEKPSEPLFEITPVVGSILVGAGNDYAIPVGTTICTWNEYLTKYKFLIRKGGTEVSGMKQSWIEHPNPDKRKIKVDMGKINYRPNETQNGEFDEKNINPYSIVKKIY